jgi:hypothetical protein
LNSFIRRLAAGMLLSQDFHITHAESWSKNRANFLVPLTAHGRSQNSCVRAIFRCSWVISPSRDSFGLDTVQDLPSGLLALDCSDEH